MIMEARARIGLFLLVTLALSGIFYGLIAASGSVSAGHGLYELGLMWAPALAALLTCRFTALPIHTLGWRRGPWRWMGFSYLIPLAYVAGAYGLVWSFGLGRFPDTKFVAMARSLLGWTHAPAALVLACYFIIIATVGMLLSLVFAAGEEIGWRGFLAPQMTAQFGWRTGAVLTGLIWSMWHLPLVLFANYNSAAPRWYAVLCFTVLMVAMSIVMAYLRLRSGTLWTAALFHASHNQFIQLFFTPATGSTGKITAYVVDEFGCMLPLLVMLLAGLVWMRQGPADPVVDQAPSLLKPSSASA